MRILFIGGTGDISYPCLHASVQAGHSCTVFNRGQGTESLPAGTHQVVGDVTCAAAALGQLAGERFDAVCQFIAYTLADIERDIALFSGNTGQYVFISSASAYQKPPQKHLLTEETPLGNPYWPYSQAKADMERRLMSAHEAGKLPVTIVRPSHTYRRRFSGAFITGDHLAWRMLAGKPVIVHGDGTSLWTLTYAGDFAPPFVKLLGHPGALGQAFHITTDSVFTWDQIIRAAGTALGAEPKIVHVATDTLVRYRSDWAGPLLGDKAWSTLFDTSKLQALAGPLPRPLPLDQGYARVADFTQRRLANFMPDGALDALLDRIIAEQARLGS